jgi:hypothetical protein
MGSAVRFTDEQVQAILARAIERADTATLTLDDLVQIGGELGVPREAVVRAAREAMAAEAPARGPDPLVAWKKRARLSFFRHLAVYLTINGFLVFVNLYTKPSYLWFVWPLFGWGIAVALQAIRLALVDEDAVREKLERKARRANKKSKLRVDDAELNRRVDAAVARRLRVGDEPEVELENAEAKRRA